MIGLSFTAGDATTLAAYARQFFTLDGVRERR